jgi:nicotinate phosphoribosyltransferase
VVVASKAVRMVLAARGRAVVDFGLRRAAGAEAGVLGARAAYIAGAAGTSNVLAGLRFGVPLSGTMAHSFVEAHEDEAAAFAAFARANPEHVVLLLDTYDTLAAARSLGRLSPSRPLRGVRLDSGDLAREAPEVRAILDGAGLARVRIFASGGLDEHAIDELVRRGTPIDGFGVGTELLAPSDAPSLDAVYKLVEYDGRPRHKLSPGKRTLPGRKQVFRQPDRDVIALGDEELAGEPLLAQVMRKGRRLAPPPPLAAVRDRVRDQLARLPPRLGALDPVDAYPVTISAALEGIANAGARGR